MNNNVLLVIIIILLLIIASGIFFFNHLFSSTINSNTDTDTKISEKKDDDVYSDIYGNWDGFLYKSDAFGGEYSENAERFKFSSNDTFKWYQSSENLKDNYFEGTFEVLQAEDALDELSISYEAALKTISNNGDNIDINDFYCINMTIESVTKNGKKDSVDSDLGKRKFLFIITGKNKAEALNYTSNNFYQLEKIK